MLKAKIILLGFLLFLVVAVWASVPSTLNDFFLPGSQPNQSGQLETPDKCDNCHGGYNKAVEPAFNWRGSMMSQAARDPLFYACMAVANQDAPQSGDLCIRCHSPAGWLEGRSIPTDGSALNLNDRQGVQCDFCHKLVKPTSLGVNPYPNDPAYTSGTYPQDQSYLSILNPIPSHSANGMYIADANNAKRGPFADPDARHQFFYSPFHKDATLCGTCHDVSNPVYYKDTSGNYLPNSFNQASPSFDPYTMFPIERTFSEWKMSAYNTLQGVYAPQFGGNKTYVSTCQDCHMKDVTGVGCNKPGAPTRTDLPFHDMTGGNTFIPLLIPSLYPGETDTAALNAGVQRAIGMLQKAASLALTVTPQGNNYLATVKVTNETGHKLPSGYPEGRRIWINLKVYDTLGVLIYESGAYDPATGILNPDSNIKVYEIKPGISADLAPAVGLPAGPSFHFVLNNQIYEDNRIPPRGFTNSNFAAIQSAPVGYAYADGQYWDQTNYSVPGLAARVVSTLYYQTTSKEYVEFLRDENHTNNWGQTLYDLWAGNGKSAPVAMATDTVELQPIIINNPPVLASIGSKSVNEGQLLSFRISATDPDGDTLTLSIINKPTGAVFVDSGNGAGSFVWTPAYDQASVYNVTFKASDGSLTDSEAVQITVNNVNRPPVLAAIGAKSVNEGQLLIFLISATDPDGNTLTMSIVNKPTGAVFFDSGNGTASFAWTPTYDQASIYNVTFKASDESLADSEVVLITVNNVNRPPVLEPIGPKTVQEGHALQFRVFASDLDGSIPSLMALNKPANATFVDSGNGAGGFVFTPDTTQSGAYQVTFTASDSVLTDTEIITITVTETANQPPVLATIGAKSISEGQLLSFRISATDPDATIPALSIVNKPTGAVFVDSGNGAGSFVWTPTFDQATIYNVTFKASDGSLVDSEIVQITVNNVNRPPVLDTIVPQNVEVGNILSHTISATDQDGTIPSLYAFELPINSVFEDSGNGRGGFVFAPESFQVGDYSVTFLASDGFLDDTSVVSISVTAAACVAVPGDANGDGSITLPDIIFLVNRVFKGGPAPSPVCRGDANADGNLTLSDIIYLVNRVFKSGPAPLKSKECCL